jgi:hypothetical protein
MIGEETFHPDTKALLAYGRALAGTGPAIQKGRADHVLDRLFVVERTKDGRLPLRTFGRELVQVFGRDLREHDLATLFLAPDRTLLHAMIDSCEAAGQPAVARAIAVASDGATFGAEILITPLKVETFLGDRFLGMFQALGGQAFACDRPLRWLKLGSVHPPEATPPRGPRLVVVND